MAEETHIKATIGLEDHVSKPAEHAGKSLEHLHSGLEEGKEGLDELSLGFLKVVEPAEVAHEAFEGAAEGLRSFVSGIKSGEAKEAIEGLTETVASLAQVLDIIVPGLGQVANAAIKMGGAVVGSFAGIVQEGEEMALEVAEVNEKVIALFDALGTGPESGKRTLDMLDDMAGKLPQTEEQLTSWAKALERANVTDLGQVRYQLKAAASAQALFGDEGADAFLKLTAKIQDAKEAHNGLLTMSGKTFRGLTGGVQTATAVAEKMHLSLGELEKRLKSGKVDAQEFGNAMSETLIEKGEKPLEAMGNELGTLKTKGKETLGHLFDGVDASPITDALKSLIDIGDQSEPSGKALKTGFTGAFNAISKMIGHAIMEFKHFFLQMEIYALEAKIKLDPLIHALEKVGVIKTHGATEGISDARKDYKAPEQRYTGGDAAKDLGIGALKSTLLFSLNPLAGTMYRLGVGVKAGFDLGVQGDLDKTHKAGVELGKAAVDGAKRGADAHSPSRLTMALGVDMSEGLARGLLTSVSIPERAARRISGSAIGSMAQSAIGGGGSSGGGGTKVEIGEVNVTAPNGITDAHQVSVTSLAVALERFQLATGR